MLPRDSVTVKVRSAEPRANPFHLPYTLGLKNRGITDLCSMFQNRSEAAAQEDSLKVGIRRDELEWLTRVKRRQLENNLVCLRAEGSVFFLN